MRRYKLVVHILVILSVFNFVPVLAAPVPVREVRDVGQGPWLTQASPGPGSPSLSDHASGVHQTSPIELPSSGTELPWYSKGDMRRPPYAKGGTELPWYSKGDMRPPYASGGTELPWYSKPASSVRTKPAKGPGTTEIEPPTSSYSKGDIRRPPYASGGTELPWYSKPASSVRTKPAKGVPTTEIEPPPSSGQFTPASSSKVHPLSGEEGYRAQTPAEQPKPQSKSFWSNLAGKSKSWFSFSKLVGNPKF